MKIKLNEYGRDAMCRGLYNFLQVIVITLVVFAAINIVIGALSIFHSLFQYSSIITNETDIFVVCSHYFTLSCIVMFIIYEIYVFIKFLKNNIIIER